MTAEPAGPSSKAEFFQLYDQSWNELDSLISSLDVDQLISPKDAQGWNVRDHLAHLVAWENSMIAFLRQRRQYEGLGITEQQWTDNDIDGINALVRELTLDDDPMDVIAGLRETNANLLDLIRAMSDDELLQPARDFHVDRAERDPSLTVLRVLHGDAGEHFAEHIPWIRKIVGK